MKMIEEVAAEYFDKGFNCAESTLLALADYFKINNTLVPAVASGFGGGIGRYGEVCGAVSGAVMALGAVHGRNRTQGQDQELKEKMNGLVQEFLKKFKERYGSLKCIDLSGCDLLSDEGRVKYKNENVHKNICYNLVKFAVIEAGKLV